MEVGPPRLLAGLSSDKPRVCEKEQATPEEEESAIQSPIESDCKDGRVKGNKNSHSRQVSTHPSWSGDGCKDGPDKR